MPQINNPIVVEQQHQTRSNLESLRIAHNETDNILNGTVETIATLPIGVSAFTVYQPVGAITVESGGNVNSPTGSVTTGTGTILNNPTITSLSPAGDTTITVEDGGTFMIADDLNNPVGGTVNVTVQPGATLSHDDQISGTYFGTLTTTGNVTEAVSIATLNQTGDNSTVTATNVTGANTSVDNITYADNSGIVVLVEGEPIDPTLPNSTIVVIVPSGTVLT